MISEDPLVQLLQLETYDAATTSWVPWFSAANAVSVQRGGKANGASTTVDVGTLSATLVNAGDPLTDTRLKPNVPIRLMRKDVGEPTIAIAAVSAYSQGFESSVDSWTAVAGTTAARANTFSTGPTYAHAGTHVLTVQRTSTGGATSVYRNLGGLTIGRSYTLTAWFNNADESSYQYSFIGVNGIGNSATLDNGFLAGWAQHSFTFVATSITHTAVLNTTAGNTFVPAYWDDVVLNQNAYTLPNPAYIPAVPVFTGRINDLATTYQLNKNTGEMTTFVNISATDAVSAHANTTRYGAVSAGGVGYETWASRVIRLATSSTATITPPADDSPIVRYGI